MARCFHDERKIRRQIVDHGNFKTGSRIRKISDNAFDCRTIAASEKSSCNEHLPARVKTAFLHVLS
jgi:hypothetical protein